MVDTFLIALGICLLIWRTTAVARVALDARRRGFESIEVGRWMLVAVVAADRYWWGARLERLTLPEARELLAETARAHGLSDVSNVRCPLCDAEIERVFAVTADGELYIRRQAKCTQCDYRADACRHCAHFLPATGGLLFERNGDFSHGRCGFYRAP